MDSRFEFAETHDAGCILKVSCFELADEFSGFINNEYFVLSEVKREKDHTIFCFGQASCEENVEKVVERFLNRPKKPPVSPDATIGTPDATIWTKVFNAIFGS